jgi:hypothetical protein
MVSSYIVSGRFWLILVVLAHVFDCVCRTDDLRGTLLSFGRPHGDARKKTTMWDFELRKGVGNVASVTDHISDNANMESINTAQISSHE